jgi:uncharacterized protein YceH (UPF0502 family)
MAPFSDVSEVESALEQLHEHEGGALVQRLAREPGRREARYAHLFSGPVTDLAAPLAPAGAADTAEDALAERLARLEADVAALRAELAALRRALGS